MTLNQIETIPVLDWHGCYSDRWQGVIHPDAFTHPAKFARGLIRKIYSHMLQNGYIQKGDKIVDPFGGVALGSYEAMHHGLHWVGCELEEKFVKMGRQNIEKFNRDLGLAFDNLGTAVLLQGDSRYFSQIVEGEYHTTITSPPFGEGEARNRTDYQGGHVGSMMQRAYTQDKQGTTDGNLATLKATDGDFDAALSSPPYADVVKKGEGTGARFDFESHSPEKGHNQSSQSAYGEGAGNLGNMREGDFDASVSSSPFEGTLSQDNLSSVERRKLAQEMGISNSQYVSPIDLEKIGKRNQPDYGHTNGQIGAESGETFWLAARQILEETYAVLAPGAYSAWVCKDFVRKGQRVPFSDQWLQLCTAVGFEPVERVRAWVVEEKGTQLDIFGQSHTKTVARKSFFRRLAEQKGSPRIDWEDVLIVRKGGW